MGPKIASTFSWKRTYNTPIPQDRAKVARKKARRERKVRPDVLGSAVLRLRMFMKLLSAVIAVRLDGSLTFATLPVAFPISVGSAV
jgi:hypothetical protein